MVLACVLFGICIAASSVGAIVGAGGGVIIKPVLDMLGLLPVSTISFCSGCTVLAMSVCSLIRTRNNGVKLHIKTSTALAIGAVIGGFMGKWLFEMVRNGAGAGGEKTLGAVQAVCLTVITFGVFLYICFKNKLPSKHIENLFVVVVIGVLLGVISSFLGIGGGTSNVAVLFFFFSMDAKEAAKNSLYIIIFSQVASIVTAVAGGTVPSFEWINLIFMMCGGVGGALLGAAISKRINNNGIEIILKIMLIALVCLDFYNVLKFTVLA